MLYEGKKKISKWTGTFLDKSLELEFQKLYLGLRTDYLRNIFFIIGTLFLGIYIFDYLSLKTLPIKLIVFALRLIIFIVSYVFYLNSDYFLEPSGFLKITGYELAFIIFFFTIIIVYEDPSFLFQCLALTIIISGIYFLVPNLLVNKIMLSIILIICFLGVSVTKFNINPREIMFTFGYFLLSIAFSIICSFNLDKYMRLDFVNKQCLIEYSIRDPLTNAYNRLKFNQSLMSQIELSKRYGNTFSLIMFDIDHFKKLNDEHGHVYGDKVLIEITVLVKACIREVDLFARWGGEEFVILLPQTSCNEASALAERLRKVISKEFSMENEMITCSFGVTTFSNDRDDIHSIMNRVDMALYRAKKNGRNLVVTEENFKQYNQSFTV